MGYNGDVIYLPFRYLSDVSGADLGTVLKIKCLLFTSRLGICSYLMHRCNGFDRCVGACVRACVCDQCMFGLHYIITT